MPQLLEGEGPVSLVGVSGSVSNARWRLREQSLGAAAV
jgi:hypothetical protein